MRRSGDRGAGPGHSADATATTGTRTSAEYLAANAIDSASVSHARDADVRRSRCCVSAASVASAAATKHTSLVVSDACATMFGESATKRVPAIAMLRLDVRRSVHHSIASNGTPNSAIAAPRAIVTARV